MLPYLCMPLHALAQALCAWMLVAGSGPWEPRAMMMHTVVNQALSPEPIHGITWAMLGAMLMQMTFSSFFTTDAPKCQAQAPH